MGRPMNMSALFLSSMRTTRVCPPAYAVGSVTAVEMRMKDIQVHIHIYEEAEGEVPERQKE
jgi:hypothetical protein